MATLFLADLHGRFGLPRSAVVRLAESAAGRQVEWVERIVRGYENEVYRVRLTGGSVVYVRIRRHGEGGLDQEVWAMGLARDVGIPVPEVLAADPSSDLADGHPVMVVAAAHGRQLEEMLAATSAVERQGVLFALGVELTRSHSAQWPGLE